MTTNGRLLALIRVLTGIKSSQVVKTVIHISVFLSEIYILHIYNVLDCKAEKVNKRKNQKGLHLSAHFVLTKKVIVTQVH